MLQECLQNLENRTVHIQLNGSFPLEVCYLKYIVVLNNNNKYFYMLCKFTLH